MYPKPRPAPMTNAERRLLDRLDLWYVRGQAARAARQPRQVPPQPGTTAPEIAALISTAWLGGYDGGQRLAPPKPERIREC